MKRRQFIKKSLLSLAGLSVFSGLYAWQIEPFWLEIVKQKMPVKNLPDALIGKTLMQISDIHIGERFDYKYILESFKKAKTYNPDFVAYTGDYVTLHKGEIAYDKLDEVLKNAVKGSLGAVAVLGNHDYGHAFSDKGVADKITGMLNANNITVLRNEEINFSGLNFIGFDDYWGPNFMPEKVMKNYDALKPNIVLCHNPDACDEAVWNNYEGWILSGHTHGGQCKAPFLAPFIIPVKNKKYTAGKIKLENNRTLYINRALGHIYQLRFNVRPEITIFELEKA